MHEKTRENMNKNIPTSIALIRSARNTSLPRVLDDVPLKMNSVESECTSSN